jgi:tryptophan synthase alpha chain
VTGVTGARAQVGDDLPDLLARLRLRTRAPLAVGFGISTPAQAAEVGDLADGVIVGSALIAMLGQGRDTQASARAVENQVRALAAALHVAKAGEGQS